MSEPRGELRFFAAAELRVHSGDLSELLARTRQVYGSGRPMVLRHEGDSNSFHLFTGSQAFELSELTIDLDDLPAYLAEYDARVVDLDTTPSEPAVVVDDGEVLGAWLEPEDEVIHSFYGGPARGEGFSVGYGISAGSAAGAAEEELVAGAGPPAEEAAAAAADDAPALGDEAIRRTPHLDAPEAIPTAPGSLIEVAVHTNSKPLREAEEGADVVIEAPPEVDQVQLDVLLAVSDHFEIVGEGTKRLTVHREKKDSEPLLFQLRVREKPPRRTAGICALFTHRRRPCGHVVRAWDWVKGAAEAPTIPGHAAVPKSLPVHIDTELPDVAVYVTAPVDDGIHFKCAVETTLVPGYEKPELTDFGLREKASELIEEKLLPLSDDSLDPQDRREALEEAGYAFWEAAPPAFKKAIWEIIDQEEEEDVGGRPKSIYIASAEPALPWELMIPTRQDGGEPSDLGEPLGVRFAIGRWSRGDAASPPQRIPIRNSFVIAPEYAEPLKSAGEVAFIKKNLHGKRIKKASKHDLDRYFRDHHASLLHFICHGAEGIENDEAIYLDDEEVLRSEALRPLKGLKALCRRRAPFVFLNACDAGKHVPALTGGAGFPRAFGDLGARAILAPLWPIKDTIAGQVAKTVYEESLQPDPKPVAEILRALRARAYEKNDADTYAAYAFFGDPRAKLQLVRE